jgi:hypothetical protein
VAHEVALDPVFLLVLRFPSLIIVPPLLHSHLSPPHAVYDSPEHCTHSVITSSLTRHLTGLEIRTQASIILHVLRVAERPFTGYKLN